MGNRDRQTDPWPNGVIPYTFESAFARNATVRNKVTGAVDEYNEKTSVRFVRRTFEPDFVRFVDSPNNKCGTSTGYKANGVQDVTCSLDSAFSIGSVIHELGHVIGLEHEHQRPDRDTYVVVGNTTSVNNCVKKSTAVAKTIGPYDFASIMHYRATSCSGIAMRNPFPASGFTGDPNNMGNTVLSPGDLSALRVMYPPKALSLKSRLAQLHRKDRRKGFQTPGGLRRWVPAGASLRSWLTYYEP